MKKTQTFGLHHSHKEVWFLLIKSLVIEVTKNPKIALTEHQRFCMEMEKDSTLFSQVYQPCQS